MAPYVFLYSEQGGETKEDNSSEFDDRAYSDRKVFNHKRWAYILCFLILVQIIIIFSTGLFGIPLIRQRRTFSDGPEPPYSPLYEDGAVIFINKNVKPEPIFQQKPSPEVEEAWEKPLRDHDKVVLIPLNLAAEGKLPESVGLHLDPGYGAYSVAVYHHIHCLNHIRKAFYPQKFFQNEAQEKIEMHKNHCFDVIRQALLCHGDPSLVYWWNDNYTFIDETGSKHYTQEFLSRSPIERAKGGTLKWDMPTRCRDMRKIDTWIEKHSLSIAKYNRTEVIAEYMNSLNHQYVTMAGLLKVPRNMAILHFLPLSRRT